MNWVARVEEACAGFIERAFANMFPSDVEPAQIARKLVATMEARSQSENGAITAPHAYAVYVHPSDFDRLEPHRTYLEHEWGALLQEVGQRVGIVFADSPSVDLREDEQAVLGAIDVEVLDETRTSLPDEKASPQGLMLRIVTGMPAGGQFAVSRSTRVGRSRECDIFLVDPSVSRQHALLEPHGEQLIVRDMGSTNGTFVNGERIQLRSVRAGDRLAFGKTEMMVEPGRTP